MSTPAKTYSPSELAKLEHSFATDPSSDAYKPLAEAYLGMGRFMEAMVVCKKGVKAHPTRAEPRMLLARVYADQGKDKKALEELTAAVQVITTDKALWRTAGEMQLKIGERDQGKTSLLKAFELDPNDADTLSAMKRYGVESPKPAAPPPPAPVAAAPGGPPVLQAVGTTSQPGAPMPAHAAPHLVSTPSNPNIPAQARIRRPSYEELERAEEVSRRKRVQKARPLMRASMVLGIALLVVPIVYYAYGQYRASVTTEFKKQMKSAEDELKHDSFSSYQKATEAAERALEADSSSSAAHGLLAYIWTIRWGEHGGGERAREKAEEHLAAAKKEGGISSYLYAADALYLMYSGKQNQALNELSKTVASLKEERRESAILNLTLGIIQANAGDFEAARDSLTHAQELAQSDARIYSALGNFYRRQGQDRLARDNFDAALRYERDHNEAMLGKSLLILEREVADFPTANKLLKKLIEMEPPPSPRQLAVAHVARGLLVARVSKELPEFKPEFQKELSDATGVPLEKSKARALIVEEEDKGFSLDPKNPDLHLLKGKRLAVEGQTDAAAQEIRAAIDLDKNRAQYYVDLARVLMSKPGGEKEAVLALTTAIHAMGESPKLLVLLGQAYQRQNNLPEALAQYQRAVADPKVKNPEARLAMGSIYRQQQEYTRAADALDKAAKEYAGQRTKVAEVFTELGRVYDEKGDKPKADEVYNAALKSDPDYSPPYFYYGRFLANQNDRSQTMKAREILREYLNREPNGEFAVEAAKKVAAL